MLRNLVRLLCLCVLSGLALAQAPAQRIRGEVVTLTGSTLQVRNPQGETVAVELADNARLIAVSRADRSAIVPGVFLGTTAVPQADGTLAAVEVHIFPESLRGTGEGHRPMASLPGSTMTNATVSEIGDVGKAGMGDQQIKLQYKGGEKVVTLAPDTPIVFLEPADRALFTPGAHVVLNAVMQDNGSLRTDRVTIGKNGAVPPM